VYVITNEETTEEENKVGFIIYSIYLVYYSNLLSFCITNFSRRVLTCSQLCY